MTLGRSDQTKKGRVAFDTYCGGFYKETLDETLKRISDGNRRNFEICNRSEEMHLRVLYRQVETNRHLFIMKNSRELKDHRENLKHFVAHRRVLRRIGRDRDLTTENNFGRYGPGTSKIEISASIDEESKKITPSFKRKREARRLLDKRRHHGVLDRSLPTADWLKTVRRPKSETRVIPATVGGQREGTRLVLPPLRTRLSKTSTGYHLDCPQSRHKGTNVRPSTFLTQSNELY